MKIDQRALRARRLMTAASLAAISAALSVSAHAQTRPAPAGEVEEVIVTGTLVRGVAPVGTQVNMVDQAAIQRSGVQSTNQLLSTLPQVTNAFNVLPTTPSSFGRSTFRPNLRNISNVGHSTTLLLMDGHNMVGAGILQTTADIGAIPPGAIERVEVVADGGSSIYGSDAVAGVINLITRTKFEGLEVKASAGFADGGYHAYTGNVTGGHDFGRGSVLVSYAWRENSPLLARERDRPRQDLRPFGGNNFGVTGCSPGAVRTPNGAVFTSPNFTPVAALPTCDNTEIGGTLFAQESQNSLFASFTYEVTPNIDFQLKALGSQRHTRNYAAQLFESGVQITNANPFFRSIAGETSQTVFYSYRPVLGDRVQSRSGLNDYQFTPTLTWRGENGWRVKALADYGWSQTRAFQPAINATVEAAALRGPGLTTSTALNPYDVTKTNLSVIQNITNYATLSGADQKLSTVSLAADGPIYTLPGGEVHLALGAQYQRTEIEAFFNPNPIGQTVGQNIADASRNVSGIYGELLVPLVGPDNSLPGIRSLNLDISGRYDRYSDAGGTTNPKFGVTWGVFDGLSLRGNWGTAFVAPSLADTQGAADASTAVLATAVVRPGDPANSTQRPEIRLQGGTPSGLKPMPATTWSVGADFAPPQIEGLKLGVTYFSIEIEKLVGLVPVGNILLYTTPAYAPFYTANPTLAQAQAAQASNGGPLTGAASLAALYGIGQDPYTLVDARRKNLGSLKVEGIDYNFSYNHPVGWGSIFASGGGEIMRKRRQQAAPGAATIDQLANGLPKWNGTVTVGTDIGEKFEVTATVNYTPGYKVVGVVGQTSVDSFAPLNMFFRYDLGENLVATLNIDNVGDTKVPFANVNGGIFASAGFLSASTLGRFVNFGLSKRF